MPNVLRKDRQLSALHLLVEGNSIRSVERLTGIQKKTVGRLLVKFGEKCRTFLDDEMRGLTLRHVQCDEIWTFVQKKQGRLNADERLTASHIGDQYLWVAFDEDTKLVPTFAVGKRSGDMARRFMVDLAKRLVLPKPHDSDAHNYLAGGYPAICQLSTDGFTAYPEAVDLAFGPYVNYGQIIKSYRNADQPGRYAPPEMIGTERNVLRGDIGPQDIITSHVERNNLTIRTFMRRFTRLSLGFSKKLECLAAAVALHVAHYNFVRRHGSLRVTPAMAAGVTRTLWRIEDLYDRVMGY